MTVRRYTLLDGEPGEVLDRLNELRGDGRLVYTAEGVPVTIGPALNSVGDWAVLFVLVDEEEDDA